MPTVSVFPSVDIPMVGIWEFLFERKDKGFPENQILFEDADTGARYTFSGLKDTSARFGHVLKYCWDWGKGDVMAVYTRNCIDLPAVIFGTLWAGGVISAVNPTYTVDELSHQLKDSGAKALVTHASCLSSAIAAAQGSGIPKSRIFLVGQEQGHDAEICHFTELRKPTHVDQRAQVDPVQDCAFLSYSSGTSGLPKGVILSHFNLVANICQAVALDRGHMRAVDDLTGPRDKVVAFLPLFHIYGLNVHIHQPVYAGYHTVLMTNFDLERFCSLIKSHRITVAYVAPPVIVALANQPAVRRHDLSSLRMIMSGAAPLSSELIKKTYSNLKVPVKQGYGLTETSPAAFSQTWADWAEAIGSVGKLVPNMQAKYMTIEDDGRSPKELALGATGEIYLRGPNVFRGYRNNPQATEHALADDGWFRTGDIGHQDSKGNLFITDRAKDLIKYKGFQIAPAELEGTLISHEAIVDVAVVGIQKGENMEEMPCAFIVLAPTWTSDRLQAAEEIMEWMNAKVAPYKRLRGGIRFVATIPRNASGKILRRLLRGRKENNTTLSRL